MLTDNYSFRRYNYSIFNISIHNKFFIFINFFFFKKINSFTYNFFCNIISFIFINISNRNLNKTHSFKFLPYKFYYFNFSDKGVISSLYSFNFFKNYVMYSFFFLKRRNVFFYFNFCLINLNSYFLSFKNISLYSSSTNIVEGLSFFLKKKNEKQLNVLLPITKKKQSLLSLVSFDAKAASNTVDYFSKFSFIKSFSSLYFIWNFIFFLPSLNFLLLNNTVGLGSNFLTFSKKLNSFLKKNIIFYSSFNVIPVNSLTNSINYKIEYLRLKTKLLYLIEDSIYNDILIRTVESIVRQKVQVLINRDIINQLTSKEWIHIELFKKRILLLSFNIHPFLNTRVLQNKILLFKNMQNNFWNEIILMVFIFYKSRDTMILLSFLYYRMQRVSMFTHKNFLKKIFLVLRLIFPTANRLFKVQGLKLRISGKISVTGNSRTRTMLFKQGLTSYSNMNIKSDYSFNIIRTETGCLGLSVWIFY